MTIIVVIADELHPTQVLSEFAKGNLTVMMTGEYNTIKTSLNHAINSINKLVSAINSSAMLVFTGSTQISDASQLLSQGSTEQASTVEELTSSISEIAVQTKQNASNAL